jgi:hypothetical protein
LSGEGVPIWQVIEEFKDKIKAQESDLKERNKGLDSLEASLKERGQFLDQREEALGAKEKEIDQRDQSLLPREHNVSKREKELGVLEEQLRSLQEEVNQARAEIQRRDKELNEKEKVVLELAERSTVHETQMKEAIGRINSVEERVWTEEKESHKVLEELSARREEVLAKVKVLSEQAALLEESKRLVMEEQRRFVEWEGTLNDRESSLGSRERSLSRRESQAPTMAEEIKPEPKMEPAVEPKPIVQEAVKAPEPEEIEELESESETFCPECRTIVSSKAESCYACGADLKNPKPTTQNVDKPEPKAEEPKAESNVAVEASEEHKDSADAKRSVSIRKIIKRK